MKGNSDIKEKINYQIRSSNAPKLPENNVSL